MNLFIHTYMYIYIHTYIHTYIHACMHTYIYIYITYTQVYPSNWIFQVLQGLTRLAILGDFTRAGEGVALDDVSARGARWRADGGAGGGGGGSLGVRRFFWASRVGDLKEIQTERGFSCKGRPKGRRISWVFDLRVNVAGAAEPGCDCVSPIH